MMRQLNLPRPTHMTEALRTNMSGGKTVTQLLAKPPRRFRSWRSAELVARIGG